MADLKKDKEKLLHDVKADLKKVSDNFTKVYRKIT